MKLVKLTDSAGQTFGGMQWGPGVTHTATGPEGGPLCSNSWIHAYEHPLLGVLHNPIHCNYRDAMMWEAEGEIGKREGQMKCGCRTLTTVRQIASPFVTTEQRVRYAIACAWRRAPENWREWARGWLTNQDRTAAWAAEAASEAAAWAAEAAEAAARADGLDLAAIAEWAMTDSVVPPGDRR